MFLGFVFVRFLDDPVEEFADVLASLRQHSHRNHVQHLHRLVQTHVQTVQIEHPQQTEPSQRRNYIQRQQQSQSVSRAAHLVIEGCFPDLKQP